jgi:uncharacterized membrane protein YagU involved in acid resistance
MNIRRKTRPINRNSVRGMERLLAGTVGGIIGTWGMTLAMRAMFRRLPEAERYPLPPREITERVTERGTRKSSERALAVHSLAAHYAYGAVTGTAFTLAGLHEHRPVLGGLAWGTAVWASSYLGWIPAAGILKPATRHPARRNALMIAAHLVWGGCLGLVVDTMDSNLAPLRKDHRPVLKDVS